MKPFFESSKIATKSIFANKLRSFLTILGVVIGVITISSLLTIALGVRNEVANQVKDLGSNLIAVVPGQIQTSSGGLNPSASFGTSTLTEDDFQTIQDKVAPVQNLSMTTLLSGTVRVENKVSGSSLIFASTEKVLPVLNVEVYKGRFLTKADVDNKVGVVVLGSKTAKILFGNQDPIGRQVEIRGGAFEIIGILKEKTTAESFVGPDINDVVIMPITTGWQISGTKQVFRIMMQAPDSDSVDSIKKRIKELLLENHKGEEDFSVLTQDELLGIIGNIFDILTAMLSAIAAISLFVAGIGIMNIMLVSVTERTKEIGIRKAVGATNTHILLQFLIESVILSLLGGLIAIVLASVGTQAIARYSPLPVSLSPLVLLLALLFSVVVGVVFGVAPAFSAAKKDPITALRNE